MAGRTGEPDLPASGAGYVWESVCDAVCAEHVRSLRSTRGDDDHPHAWSGDIRARPLTLIGRSLKMKKLMMLMVLGAMLAGTTGCHIGECWTYAWNSRFHPERNAPRTQQCVVVDPCDPCDACGSSAPMAAPCPSCGN